MKLRNWFPHDFSRQLMAATTREHHHPQLTEQNMPESSSSSLRSLSYDSPEYAPFLQIGVSSEHQQEPIVDQQLGVVPALRPSPTIFTTTSFPQQALISQIRSPQVPSIESEDAAMANAILAVISCSTSNNPNNNNNSPSVALSSSNFSLQPQQNLPPNTHTVASTRGGRQSAFKWYGSASASAFAPRRTPSPSRFRRQNMLKRSLSFLRSINAMRSQSQEHNMQTSGRTSSTQLHHMISERRRREKLNESFQALRSLLPPGTKKDKASVLMGTTEYLSSLKAEVAELSKRNASLEAQLLPKKTVAAAAAAGEAIISSSSPNERYYSEIGITQVSESTSSQSSSSSSTMGSARLIDLHVTRVGEISITDMVVRLLEFLKRSDHHQSSLISLMSIEANTTLEESNPVNRIVLRLKIQGECDESAFQEAVRRVVNDQTQ